MSVVFCPECHQILDKILKVHERFSNIIVCNDNHQEDDEEFKYLPPHVVSVQDKQPIADFFIKSKRPIEVLNKNTLSAAKKSHNLDIIKKSREVILAGFNLSLDIIPTALDLIQNKVYTKVAIDLCGDLRDDIRYYSVNYLNFLGVPIDSRYSGE